MLNMKINLVVSNSNVYLGQKYHICFYEIFVTGEMAELQTLNDRVNG